MDRNNIEINVYTILCHSDSAEMIFCSKDGIVIEYLGCLSELFIKPKHCATDH